MSIDSVYEGVIAKLTSDGKILPISQKLLKLTCNADRVLCVHDILESLNVLPSAIEVHKTENVSTYYRNLGNQYYQNKDDYRAWQFYNLSLLHAPIASDNYTTALANRSAVFYSLKKYLECAKDIENVFSLKYPNKLKDKLEKRLTLCQESLKKKSRSLNKSNEDSFIDEVLTLQGAVNPRYPYASTKLEVVFTKEMGRHVVAREDIKVGELLVEEKPYFTLLLKSQYLFSCSYCLSRSLNLLPCKYCCFSLYCSSNCRESAWKEYHSIECPLMATLVHMEFTKLELLALRTVLKARNEQPDWHSLFRIIEEAELNMNTELRGHVKIEEQWVYDSKYYTSIHTLASNIEKRSISDIFQKAVTAAVFLHLLSSKTVFLRAENDSEKEQIQKCVAGTLLLHIMTSPTNMHGLSTNLQTSDGNFVDELSLASAPYAFHSLLNHSCAPNVVRFSKLGTDQMSLFALRPIKKGTQIFDNYGPHHALLDRCTRQDNLKFQYKFTCICEACANNWPTYPSMVTGAGLTKSVPRNLVKIKTTLLDEETIDNLQKGNKETAMQLFKPLCEMLEVLEPYAPCVELADCQETLKQCLAIFEGLLLYGFSKLVEWNALPPKM